MSLQRAPRGRPITLLSRNGQTKQWQMHKDAARFLQTSVHKPVAIVIMSGKTRTGKSSLLNKLLPLLGLNGDGGGPGTTSSGGPGFAESASSEPVTQGVVIWSEVYDAGSHCVLLLDSEGVDDSRQDELYAKQLSCFIMLLSSVVLMNVKGNLLLSDIKYVYEVAHFSAEEVYRATSAEGRLRQDCELPSMLLLVRDFNLDVLGTPQDWLAQRFEEPSGQEDNNKYKAGVTAAFSGRDVLFFPLPSQDPAPLDAQLSVLATHLKSPYLPVKSYDGRKVLGSLLPELLSSYVKAVNEGGWPDIGGTLDGVDEVRCQRASAAAMAVFNPGAAGLLRSFNTATEAGATVALALVPHLCEGIRERAAACFEKEAGDAGEGVKQRHLGELFARTEELMSKACADLGGVLGVLSQERRLNQQQQDKRSEQQLAGQQQQLARLGEQLAEQAQQLAKQSRQLAEQGRQLAEQQQQLAKQEEQLASDVIPQIQQLQARNKKRWW